MDHKQIEEEANRHAARRDEYLKQLQEARDKNLSVTFTLIGDTKVWQGNVGAIAFGVAAASVPLIADKTASLPYPGAFLAGVFGLLITGMSIFVAQKRDLENDGTDSSVTFAKHEAMIRRFVELHNQLAADPLNQEAKSELEQYEQSTVKQLLKEQEGRRTKRRMYMRSDWIILGLLSSTLLLISNLWPWSLNAYLLLCAVVYVVLFYFIASSIRKVKAGWLEIDKIEGIKTQQQKSRVDLWNRVRKRKR